MARKVQRRERHRKAERRKLFHFTCSDAASSILTSRVLRPGPRWRVVWLTDLPNPNRLALGLTSNTLACDRMAWRFIVKTTTAVPWAEARPWMLEAGLLVDPREIEETEGADPAHWFVSAVPVKVLRGGRYLRDPQPLASGLMLVDSRAG